MKSQIDPPSNGGSAPLPFTAQQIGLAVSRLISASVGDVAVVFSRWPARSSCEWRFDLRTLSEVLPYPKVCETLL